MAITFTVTLLSKDWRDEFNGWDCSALGLPSAEVTEIRVGGVKQDDMYYKVDTDHQIIQWTGNPRPESVLVSIKVAKDLAPAEQVTEAKETADKWKQIAIIAPIVGTVLTALITAFTTLYLSSQNNSSNRANTNADNTANANSSNKNSSSPDASYKVRLIFPPNNINLDQIRDVVAKDQKARIVFSGNCKESVIKGEVTTANAELKGLDVKDFLENKIRPRASNKNFCVKEIQKDNSYEIDCQCNL